MSKRGFTDCNELPVDVPAQEVIIHPEYKDSKRVHDIALIRLSFAINFTGKATLSFFSTFQEALALLL